MKRELLLLVIMSFFSASAMHQQTSLAYPKPYGAGYSFENQEILRKSLIQYFADTAPTMKSARIAGKMAALIIAQQGRTSEFITHIASLPPKQVSGQLFQTLASAPTYGVASSLEAQQIFPAPRFTTEPFSHGTIPQKAQTAEAFTQVQQDASARTSCYPDKSDFDPYKCCDHMKHDQQESTLLMPANFLSQVPQGSEPSIQTAEIDLLFKEQAHADKVDSNQEIAAEQNPRELDENCDAEMQTDDSKDEDFVAESSKDSNDEVIETGRIVIHDVCATAHSFGKRVLLDLLDAPAIGSSDDQSDQEADEELQPKPKKFKTAVVIAAATQVQKKGTPRSVEKPFKCPYEGCDKAYSWKDSLTVHKRSHAVEKPFKCLYEGCGKAFPCEQFLTVHATTHTVEKPFKCPYEGCGKAYSWKYSLTLHEKIHTEGKPFKSPYEDCWKNFITSSNPRGYKRIHPKGTPHTCDECGQTFKFKYILDDHMQTQHGKHPYECKQCNIVFSKDSSLKRHISSFHNVERRFICAMCDQPAYSSQQSLDTHVNTMHP